MVRRNVCIVGIALFFFIPFAAWAQVSSSFFSPASDSIAKYFSSRAVLPVSPVVRSCRVLKNTVIVNFSKTMGDYPWRKEDVSAAEEYIRACLPEKYTHCKVSVSVDSVPLENFVSGYYSGRKYPYSESSPRSKWIKHVSALSTPAKGLDGRYIALWSGHGLYYNSEEDRWKWQRAPFFSTIEDLFPADYICSFLAPMLENAGARVLIPKERDRNLHEIIVDASSPFYSDRNDGEPWTDSNLPGFSDTCENYDSGENPFRMGTARIVMASRPGSATAVYMPSFPEPGFYSVYVSYQSLPGSTEASYKVIHAGGESMFNVNQSIAGGVWVYLGTFEFSGGETGQGVVLTNAGKGVLSADAVRFGGGMGNIKRNSSLSGMPRFAESSRYWLQWSGYPKSVYSPNADTLDYADDYMSKGLWVNYMKDTLGIPVDLALALHTDAGTTKKDSTIGTLAIYTSISEDKDTYPDGTPRAVSREFADIVQTQVVDDIRKLFRKDWSRRGLADRSYFESRIPDVPTVLVELLSHQNFQDMQLGLDPEFKFVVSRAIYKGILKYLSYTEGRSYTVQPLPVMGFSSKIEVDGNGNPWAVLKWSPQTDSLEQTAGPESYIIQVRTTDPYSGKQIKGFDRGTIVGDTVYRVRIDKSKLYSFRVLAVNDGGISFPSEILSLGYMDDSPEVLVVNAFRTVSGPAVHSVCDTSFAGFDFMLNPGIPYISDYSFTGNQYEYDREKDWIHDDNPGHGASFMDYAAQQRAGNSFDYPSLHGMAIMKSGMSFCSASVEALDTLSYPLGKYAVCDIITGVDTASLRMYPLLDYLKGFSASGGSLLLSGSNIGDALDEEAAKNLFKFTLMNRNATKGGNVLKYNIRNKKVISMKQFCFHPFPNPIVFPAVTPDAIVPYGKDTYVFMRYKGANTAAAVIYDGQDYRSAAFGFPLETITSPQQFMELMGEVMDFLAEIR